MIVFLSIHPQHAHSILEGRKRFEFRRVPPREAKMLILYATTPVRRIVGHAKVVAIHEGSLTSLWKKCAGAAGVTRGEFMSYFAGRKKAFAIEIERATRLAHPVEIGCLGDFSVPQSYRYLDNGRFSRVLAQGSGKAA